MIEDGLFVRFPVERVYGMHNFPGLSEGSFSMREGPIMAAFDKFEITVEGRGTHAAIPHAGIDPIVVAAQIVTGLQSVVSRRIDPIARAVLSITQINAGNTWNVIPEVVVLRGCTRSFVPTVQTLLESAMKAMVEGIAEAHDARAELIYTHRLSRHRQHRRRNQGRRSRRQGAGRRSEGRSRRQANDGLRRLRLHAPGAPRSLRSTRRRSRSDGPSPPLRLQRPHSPHRSSATGRAWPRPSSPE